MQNSPEVLAQILQRDLLGKTEEGYDLRHYAGIVAAIESAEYYNRHMLSTPHYDNKFHLLTGILKQIRVDGLLLEFGVATGATINHIAAHKPERKIYGFDWFAGLPETWRYGFPKGSFAQSDLPIVRDNCELVVGTFENTLPKFIEKMRQPIALLHIDCDLYSSAKTVLTHCAPYIVKGTVIVFDEYFNYPGWQQHEYRAWQEYCQENSISAKHLGLTHCSTQVAFMVE